MIDKSAWTCPTLVPLQATVSDAENGFPSKQNIDGGSGDYAS